MGLTVLETVLWKMLGLKGLHSELELKSSFINMVDTLGISYPKEKT